MDLSPQTLGALSGIAVVLGLAILARRSEQRALNLRLQIVQDKIRRRQEQLAAEERALGEAGGDTPDTEE